VGSSGNGGVLAGVRGNGGVSNRGNGSAVDGSLNLGCRLLGLGGLGGLDNGSGSVGRDGQGGSLGDRVGLLLIGDNGGLRADKGGLLDNLGGCNGVLLVLGSGGNRVLLVLDAGLNGVSRGGGSSVGRSRGSVGLNNGAGVVGRVAVGVSLGRSGHSENSEGTHLDCGFGIKYVGIKYGCEGRVKE
jgi:hypothetical protein